VRIVQAAAGASHAGVALRHGPVLAAHARFGTVTRYRTVRAGTWRVTASAAKRVSGVAPHTAGRLHTATDVPVRSGHLLTLVVADASSGGGLSVRTLADVAASDRAPAGAVPAGGGGMATTPVDHPGAPSGPVTGVLALLGAIALWAGLRRVRAVHRRRTAVPRGSS
jgi:hypothetical protein